MTELIYNPPAIIWPLSALLVCLFVLRQLRDDVKPIFTNIINGVAKNAQMNAMTYAMALMLGTLSSLQALTEVATQLGWLYVAAAAKVLQPGLAAVVALMTKTSSSQRENGHSTPPMP